MSDERIFSNLLDVNLVNCKIKIQTVIYSPNFYFFLSFRNTAQRVLQAVYSRKRFQLHVAHIKKAHF